jgi:hypothetical protein
LSSQGKQSYNSSALFDYSMLNLSHLNLSPGERRCILSMLLLLPNLFVKHWMVLNGHLYFVFSFFV